MTENEKLYDDIGHNLKTPLTSIKCFSRFLIDNKVDDEQQKRYLSIIYKNS